MPTVLRYWGYIVVSVAIAGCDPAPTVGGSNLIIESPERGRVLIGSEEQFVDPLTPAVFSNVGPGPHDITFISDTRRLTLLEISGQQLDLAGIIPTEPVLRDEVQPILIRPNPWTKVEVSVVTSDRVYGSELTEAGLLFNVPRGVSLTAIAVWRHTTPPQITVEEIGVAEELQGHNLSIVPKISLDGEMPVQVLNPPTGWMDAEIVYAGVRTGLTIGGGRVGPGRAAIIPITRRIEGLSLWVTATSRGVADEKPSYISEASVGVIRPSIALSWTEEPDVNPRPRAIGEAFPLVRDPKTWSVNTSSHEGDNWFDIQLEGLGMCRPVSWQLFGSPTESIRLPSVAAGDPLSAPLIRADLSAVSAIGLDLPELLSGPFDENLVAQRTPERARTASRAYYRGAASDCDEETALAGQYSMYRADATCTVDGVGASYLIDPCGHLIQLRGAPGADEVCGQFGEDAFDSLGRSGLGFLIEDSGTVVLGLADTNVRLVPVLPANSDLVPRELRGVWQRYEITEQDFLRLHADNSIPTDDPVRIASGDARDGPWLDVKATGHSLMRTAFTSMEITMREDSDGLFFEVNHPGCEAQPRALRVIDTMGLLELHEEVLSTAPDEFKVRVYRFWR